MEPFVKMNDELQGMEEEALRNHIRWLYRYIEEIKHELRVARVKV